MTYLLNIKNKIKERYQQIANHPLVKNPIIGLIKYIFLNIIIRIYNKPIKIKWINNLRYYLSIGDSGMIGNYYFFISDYEESIFLMHYLTAKDLFIDVGSNHGHYTMISSGICNSKSISIEPVKKTFKRLEMNIELNKLKNVKLLNMGISDSEGELFFSNNMGSMNRVINKSKKNNCELIKVTTLDKLLVAEQNISSVKIDVEGYEKQVLDGCKETLKNPNLNVIIIELNDSNQLYDYSENETISILEEYGFSPYKYIYPGNVLIPLEKKNYDSFNTIFIKNINFVKNRIEKKSILVNKNRIELTKVINQDLK
tara:strand:- start:4228 stop:5166 length:939 start_codon:yes stop_codon:yes gene_type:complete